MKEVISVYAMPGLRQADGHQNPRILTTIAEIVCEEFNVKIIDLEGSCRKRKFVVPRQTWMVAMKEFADISHERIGKIAGDKDHATVTWALKRIRGKWLNDSHWGPKITRVFDRMEAIDSAVQFENFSNPLE